MCKQMKIKMMKMKKIKVFVLILQNKIMNSKHIWQKGLMEIIGEITTGGMLKLKVQNKYKSNIWSGNKGFLLYGTFSEILIINIGEW